jgi:hypothetical protein
MEENEFKQNDMLLIYQEKINVLLLLNGIDGKNMREIAEMEEVTLKLL